MPRRNRVTPLGEIIATPARGTLMGNRGCLHNRQQQIIRPYQIQRWIICQLQFKGWHRPIMKPGHYTELFFLDEATALAAGHRPCAECSRTRFEEFRLLWARANAELAGEPRPRAGTIDNALHRERLDAAQEKMVYSEKLGALPDGSFVLLANDRQPYLVFRDFLLAWSPEGYHRRIILEAGLTVGVLTPRSIVNTLAQGYDASIHPSVLEIAPSA
ncbi:MAG: hypothetical protein ACREOO_18875 [bacterium]